MYIINKEKLEPFCKLLNDILSHCYYDNGMTCRFFYNEETDGFYIASYAEDGTMKTKIKIGNRVEVESRNGTEITKLRDIRNCILEPEEYYSGLDVNWKDEDFVHNYRLIISRWNLKFEDVSIFQYDDTIYESIILEGSGRTDLGHDISPEKEDDFFECLNVSIKDNYYYPDHLRVAFNETDDNRIKFFVYDRNNTILEDRSILIPKHFRMFVTPEAAGEDCDTFDGVCCYFHFGTKNLRGSKDKEIRTLHVAWEENNSASELKISSEKVTLKRSPIGVDGTVQNSGRELVLLTRE